MTAKEHGYRHWPNNGFFSPGRWLLLTWLLALGPAYGQNHPELRWRQLETEHFRVLYHQGLERTAQVAADIAEKAYGPVTQLYGYQPADKVRIVLKDYDDYANGAAYYYQDTIEIWTSSLDHDFDLRGTSDWLPNVITHEFTHIVSLGASRKGPQRMPALYLQYFGYQREENRTDILIGYPDILASYPLMTTVVPMWFAEGVAQYQTAQVHHDRWDSHRDMVLRTAVLDSSLLAFDAMGVFAKKGLGNEYVYDHGYGLVRYIAQTYGDDKLAAICRGLSAWSSLNIDGVFEQVLGLGSQQLYGDWYQSMLAHYQGQVGALGPLLEGEVVANRGFSNIRPALSPDGRYLAYLSTRSRHYGPHLLVLRELASGEEEVLSAGIEWVSWAPDSGHLLLSRKDRADKYGSRQADIYTYDIEGAEAGWMRRGLQVVPAVIGLSAPESPRLQRLTRGLRALYPTYSPDGAWIAFIKNEHSTNNLGLFEVASGEVRYLTEYDDGTLLYTPQWAPDGQSLVLSMARGEQRDIVRVPIGAVGAAGSDLEIIVGTKGTDRDPVWSRDGRDVVFASDRSGIFNLYRLELDSRRLWQLTNVVGGALSPSLGAEGQIVFAAYDSSSYQLRQVDRAEGRAAGSLARSTDSLTSSAPKNWPLEVSGLQGKTGQEYGIDFLKTSILPRLVVDEGRFKGGVYLSSSDVLNRHSVFAGGGLAPTNGDRDLFAIYENRRWRPTLFLEFFQQKRHSARRDSSEARDQIITGIDFNLSQVNIGARGRVGRRGQLTLSGTYERYDASLNFDAFLPRRDGGLGLERQKQKPIGYTYLNGFSLGATYRYDGTARRRDRIINPRGRQIVAHYDRVFNFYIEGFNPNVSFIDEEYIDLFYNQWTLDWREYLGLPKGASLGLRFYGGWIDSDNVDDKELIGDFFDYHLGGIQYMRGYTFYSIEGRKAAMGGATLRFPLWGDVGRRAGHLYIDQIYGAFYGDIGKAWDSTWDADESVYGEDGVLQTGFGRKGPLRDVGGQVRFDLISYYSVPTRVQMDIAYGIDEVAGKSPWKFYLTVLFGYL
ncbi:MAG: BamA/TamA family outer membrane protein [Candidatus Latescibacteria bacterium]|nr:BamA/TamA family outer membrane protein [Candidatus Latescibacterota bacterium]